MEVKKVEIIIDSKLPDTHKVYICHNGMDAWYYLEDSLRIPTLFHKELENFTSTFFDLGEEDWLGVMSPDDVKEVFSKYSFIHEVS